MAVLDGNPSLCGVDGDEEAKGRGLVLSAESLALIREEMAERFSGKIDWSLIS